MSPCPEYLPTGNALVNLQDIYQGVTEKYNQSMTIYEVRKDNIEKLILERFGGVQRKFAEAIDRQPDYISRILKGGKNVGEAFARHVESSMGLDTGALDVPRGEAADDLHTIGEQREYYGKEEPNFLDAPEMAGSVEPPAHLGKAELEFCGHLDAWDSSTPLHPDEVELPLFREVELSAGAGATQVMKNHGAKLRFAKSTLRRAHVPPESAACAFVKGNSMAPIMPDGATVGVNTADTDIRDGEIYAIDHNGMLRVKFLHRKPGGGIRIVSQNSAEHGPEEYDADQVKHQNIRIIGRVFWWSVLR